MIKKKMSEEQALIKAADLCVRSEKCEFEISAKLRNWGLSPASVSSVLIKLKKDKFIDNSRFSKAFAHDKVRFSKWGRRKIRLALIAKRVAPEDIKDALDSIDEIEYYDILYSITESKAKTLNLNDGQDREKLFSFLLSRGFEPDLIKETIKEVRLASISRRK